MVRIVGEAVRERKDAAPGAGQRDCAAVKDGQATAAVDNWVAAIVTCASKKKVKNSVAMRRVAK